MSVSGADLDAEVDKVVMNEASGKVLDDGRVDADIAIFRLGGLGTWETAVIFWRIDNAVCSTGYKA